MNLDSISRDAKEPGDRFRRYFLSHNSYYEPDEDQENEVVVVEYEPDLVYLYLHNSHLNKKEALTLIELLKVAVEVMED